MGFIKRLLELIKTEYNNKDRMMQIYQLLEKIRDFNLDAGKTAAKISRICTNKV